MNTDEKVKCVVEIPIDKITVNPYQPRKNFDRNALNELAQSIKEYGVIQPITVRNNCIGGYELIYGERRLRASKLAEKTEIPCIIIDADENESAIIAMLENVQRADLSFLEEADAINHLLNEHKFTQEQLAKKLGKSQSAIANKLRLLKLSPEIKNMIIRNNLTERHARAILRLPIDELRVKALKNICTYNYNVQQTDELVDRMLEKMRGEEKKSKGKIKGVVQLRTFINTINKAVDVVKKAGVDIETQKEEKESFVEYVIKIPKLGQERELTIE